MLFLSQQNPIYGTPPPLFGSHEQKKEKKKKKKKKKKNSSIIIFCVFVQYPQAKPQDSKFQFERSAKASSAVA
jgi:hypothetical protein